MVGGFLLSLSLAYIYALANIAIVIGWTPRDVAIHYYGADEVIRTESSEKSAGEKEFSLDEVSESKTATDMGARPSFKNLVQEGHFHLFGMTSFFFALSLLGLFTGIPEKFKAFLVGIPYITIVLDNLSFMATRFWGPHFAYLTAIAGGLMGLSFATLWVVVGIEIFKKPEV